MSFLNRSMPIFDSVLSSALPYEWKSAPHVDPSLASALQRELKGFDTRVQEYGEWLSGYDWSLYVCLTYSGRQSQRSVHKKLTQFLRGMKRAAKGGLASVAVHERRTSGLGLPPIPSHWHLLIGCPLDKEYNLSLACHGIWKQNGSCDVRPYCPTEAGAFYIAKTAKHVNFEYRIENLERMQYNGSQDLHLQMALNPYVPNHAKWKTELETLTLRDREVR